MGDRYYRADLVNIRDVVSRLVSSLTNGTQKKSEDDELNSLSRRRMENKYSKQARK